MISVANIDPCDLGLPEQFETFRPAQREAIEQVLNSEARFQSLCLPTGSGKTLIAMAIAQALDVRTVILTSTLGLQQQYRKDFSNLVDIRGKRNYTCKYDDYHSCQFGMHEGCTLTNSSFCTYEGQRISAKLSPRVITNYSYWIRINKHSDGLSLTPKEANVHGDGSMRPVELLILDEAHKAVEELSNALQVKIPETWLKAVDLKIGRKVTMTPKDWSKYASVVLDGLRDKLPEWIEAHQKNKSTLTRNRVYCCENLIKDFETLSEIDPDDWICELQEGTDKGRIWTLTPVWPGEYSNRLFRAVPKVVLMSATLRPIVLQMLGVPKDKVDFTEWPRVFPAQNTPIYHLNTTRMNSRTPSSDIDKWVARIDEIISARQDRKGIIHTVSYDRQRYLLAHSKHKALMVVNNNATDSESAEAVVARFREMQAPAILVSPSFGTGWDFPGTDCEYQIISKLPFPDGRGALMKARMERHSLYGNFLTMQDLVQSCGRGTRSYDDRCEVFVVDDNVKWFLFHNRSLAPRWFSTITINDVPVAPPKMELHDAQILSVEK